MTIQASKHVIVIFAIAAAGLFQAGCNPGTARPVACPGRTSLAEAVDVLNGRWGHVRSFYANGTCLWNRHDGKKNQKENFPVKVWAEPPGRFCLHGDIVFDSRGIVLGSSEDEFWLVIRPKEMRCYFWGEQAVAEECFSEFVPALNPRDLADAFGLVRFDQANQDKKWSLSNQEQFDILTLLDESGRVIKKLWLDTCNYQVRRIEYFEPSGSVVAVSELSQYKKISESFSVPGLISISRLGQDGMDSVELTLRNIEAKELSDKQKKYLFTRPPQDKQFEDVYKLSRDCEFIPFRVVLRNS